MPSMGFHTCAVLPCVYPCEPNQSELQTLNCAALFLQRDIISLQEECPRFASGPLYSSCFQGFRVVHKNISEF